MISYFLGSIWFLGLFYSDGNKLLLVPISDLESYFSSNYFDSIEGYDALNGEIFSISYINRTIAVSLIPASSKVSS